MTRSFRALLFSLACVAGAWLPGTASAQGVLMGSADLDGDGIAETVYNNGSYITVKNTSGSSYNYQVSGGSWALLYGNFTSVQDLDGTPGAEIPINVGSALRVITHRTHSVDYYMMSGSWAASPGGIVDLDGSPGAEIAIVAGDSFRVVIHRYHTVKSTPMTGTYAVGVYAIKDLDGIPGAEVPIANGSALRIYSARSDSWKGFYVSSGSWAICNVPGTDCVSDLNGDGINDLILILPNMIYTLDVAHSRMYGYPIHAQYAILSDGVRQFDGDPGNDIAVSRNDGMITIIRPRYDNYYTINGKYTFGNWWSLRNYVNLDGSPGDEIIVHNEATNITYVVYPRSGTVMRQ